MVNKSLIIVVKGVAAVLGLAGVSVIIMFGYMSIGVIFQERDYSFVLLLVMAVLFGIVMIWVAYQILFDYSLKSIKSLSTILAILSIGPLMQYSEPLLRNFTDTEDGGLMFLIVITPLIAMVFLYMLLVYILKRGTLDRNDS